MSHRSNAEPTIPAAITEDWIEGRFWRNAPICWVCGSVVFIVDNYDQFSRELQPEDHNLCFTQHFGAFLSAAVGIPDKSGQA